jgi:hypothetical protein
MRRIIIAVMGTVAVIGATASLAAGASPPLCGTLYTPTCRAPQAVVASIAACKAAGATVNFPISLSANAGIKKVTVTFRGKTIKSVSFSGKPTKKKLTAGIHTAGLSPGIYSVSVKITDARGKSKTSVAHFSICHPAPIFTG